MRSVCFSSSPGEFQEDMPDQGFRSRPVTTRDITTTEKNSRGSHMILPTKFSGVLPQLDEKLDTTIKKFDHQSMESHQWGVLPSIGTKQPTCSKCISPHGHKSLAGQTISPDVYTVYIVYIYMANSQSIKLSKLSTHGLPSRVASHQRTEGAQRVSSRNILAHIHWRAGSKSRTKNHGCPFSKQTIVLQWPRKKKRSKSSSMFQKSGKKKHNLNVFNSRLSHINKL